MKKFNIIQTGILIAVLLIVTRQTEAQNVAYLGASGAGSAHNADVQAKLQGTGQFTTVDIIDVTTITPTLAELQVYDAVLVSSDFAYADPVTLGNTLADYHDAGGGVVTALFERQDTVNKKLQGRWEAETYNVFAGGSLLNGPQQTLGTVHEPSHPVMAGINTFDGGSSSFRPGSTNLTAGSILIAEWSDGMPLVAIKCIHGHPRVDLGFYPVSSDVTGIFWQSSTDGALLMANALSYAANPPDSDGDGIPDTCDTPSVHNLTQATDHYTLQSAINAAVTGDEIEADPGTYPEAINFTGKAITVRSTSGNPNDTIIDGNGALHVVQCATGEGSNTVLSGFTITGGNANIPALSTTGGGMYNIGGSPTVIHCIFSGNTATTDGGGMYNYSSNPTVTYCIFSGNTANDGGGMYNINSSPTVTHCSFSGNTVTFGDGGGMYNYASAAPAVTNCSFSGNTATFGDGGAMYNHSFSAPAVTNCILWGDVPDEIFDDGGTSLTVSFSDLQGGLPVGTIDGGGNIDADPLFVDVDGADNIVGTLDDNLRLQAGSPAIDAGSNLAVSISFPLDLNGNQRIVDDPATTDTGVGFPDAVDMGAYEFGSSPVPCIPQIEGDINCDGIVDLLDLGLLAANWLVSVTP